VVARSLLGGHCLAMWAMRRKEREKLVCSRVSGPSTCWLGALLIIRAPFFLLCAHSRSAHPPFECLSLPPAALSSPLSSLNRHLSLHPTHTHPRKPCRTRRSRSRTWSGATSSRPTRTPARAGTSSKSPRCEGRKKLLSRPIGCCFSHALPCCARPRNRDWNGRA